MKPLLNPFTFLRDSLSPNRVALTVCGLLLAFYVITFVLVALLASIAGMPFVEALVEFSIQALPSQTPLLLVLMLAWSLYSCAHLAAHISNPRHLATYALESQVLSVISASLRVAAQHLGYGAGRMSTINILDIPSSISSRPPRHLLTLPTALATGWVPGTNPPVVYDGPTAP